MATTPDSGGGGGGGGGDRERRERRHPRITRRWLETAVTAHRQAFEREMERQRRSVDREFKRFWRAKAAM